MGEMSMDRFFGMLNESARKKACLENEEQLAVLAKKSKPIMANKTVKKESGGKK
jgi:hypothetical protein